MDEIAKERGSTDFRLRSATAKWTLRKACKLKLATLTLRLLMSYIYMEHLFLMFLDHTQRGSTVNRTPLDE